MTNVIPLHRKRQTEGENDMSVVTVLPISSPRLHADRRRYRHAYESAVVLGVAPGMSSFELYLFNTHQMLRAKVRITPPPICHKFEAVAAYVATTGIRISPKVLKRGRYLAAMDGLTDDGKRVVDIILDDGGDYAVQDLRDKLAAQRLPEQVVIRLQHLMPVAVAKCADLWAFDQRSGTGQRVSIPRSVGLFARIFTAWDMFQKCVDDNRPTLWAPVP